MLMDRACLISAKYVVITNMIGQCFFCQINIIPYMHNFQIRKLRITKSGSRPQIQVLNPCVYETIP